MGVPSLSKSRFTAGLQCQRQLWWKVHEPDAPELIPDVRQQALFDQGRVVGDRARTYVPGGRLIDLPFEKKRDRVEATSRALDDGERVVYEAAFLADGAFAAVDILERVDDGFTLIEVKSSTKVKDEHIPDTAMQVHVLRRAGLPVARAEVMHLNRDCNYPDLGNLFERQNVTAQVELAIPWVKERIGEQIEMLAGPLPEIAIGEHCSKPYKCPFWDRCWPELPPYHISTLYYGAVKARKLEAEGYVSLRDVPRGIPLNPVQARQVESVRVGHPIVEPALGPALDKLAWPIAFLDFETISPAIPVWDGCRPYDRVPVQFSCHVERQGALTEHYEWLAEGSGDPRPELARKLVRACAGVKTVVAYNAAFERDCLRTLAAGAPEWKDALADIESKLFDALPLVRENVYHPDFAGSFGLKSVYPALVEENEYDRLTIADGELASIQLTRLLLEPEKLTADERARLREDLKLYCAQDTRALSRVVERLREMASVPS